MHFIPTTALTLLLAAANLGLSATLACDAGMVAKQALITKQVTHDVDFCQFYLAA